MAKSSIRALAELILQNIDTIEDALDKRQASVPSLDDPFTPVSDIANWEPELMATTELTVRAASQLIQTLRLPQYSVIHEALSVSVPLSTWWTRITTRHSIACYFVNFALCHRPQYPGDSARSRSSSA